MDNALLAGSVREENLKRLMEEYGDSILHVCYGYLKDYALAEDATQDTFIKAYKHLHEFRAAEQWSEKAWLMRIAANTCKDYRKSAWFRHVDRGVDFDALPLFGEILEPKERQLINDVMALAPRYRMVILLYYYQELPIDEMVKVLHVSRSTVYHRLKKAQERLRAVIEEDDYE